MNEHERADFWIDAKRILSPDEFRILRMLADGYTCEDIAELSTFCRRTAYNKKGKICEKLQIMLHKTPN